MMNAELNDAAQKALAALERLRREIIAVEATDVTRKLLDEAYASLRKAQETIQTIA